MKTKQAFTLIELLVVVAIVALLLALLLPAIDNARDRAVTVQCLAQLRQLTMAHLTYAGDNNGATLSVFAVDPWVPTGVNWHAIMDRYVSATPAGVLQMWTDPSVPTVHPWQCNPPHYGLNPGLDGQVLGSYLTAFVRLGSIRYPTTTGMYFDKAGVGAGPDFDNTWNPGGGHPWINGNFSGNNGYGPWPLHRRGTVVSAPTLGSPPAPYAVSYYVFRDTNVSRMDGSARSYPYLDLNLLNSKRKYLYTGDQAGAGMD